MSESATVPFDRVPFDEVYAHRAWVQALASRLVRDPGGAQDVVQQTWLEAFERPPRRGNTRGWLGTVVRSRAFRMRRDDDRRTRHESAALAPADALDPARIVAAAEVHRRVVNLVMELDEPYRSTVLLRFFEDLPTSEIARRLGLPLDTVRTRLRRALAILRARLTAAHGGDLRAWALPLLGLDLGLVPEVASAHRLSQPVPLLTTGVAFMTNTQKIALLGAAVLLFAGSGAWFTTRSPAAVPSAAPSRGDAASAAVAGSPRQRHADRAPAEDDPHATANADPSLPELEIDRTRDLHGEVVGEDGSAVAGATLRVVPPTVPDGPPSRREPEPATTRSDGKFSIRLDPGDVVDLLVEAPGFARLRATHLQAGARERIVLPRAVQVRVSVRGSDGRPAPGVRVVVQPGGTPASGPRYRPQMPGAEAVTDSAGHALFGSFAAGPRVYVAVWPTNGDEPATVRETLVRDLEIEIALRRGEPRDDVRGTILDASNGSPIAGADLSSDSAVGKTATTGPDGTFVIPGGALRETAAWLRVSAEGYVYSGAEVPATKRDAIEIPLRPAVTVVARIVDTRGETVEGATVLQYGAVSDAQGRIRIEGLDEEHAQEFLVAARDKGMGRFRMPVQPGARVRDVGDVRLAPSGQVFGRVVWPDGTPAVRMVVLLRGPTGAEGLAMAMWRRVTDDLGRFRFCDVEPGDYSIGASAGEVPAAARNVKVVDTTPVEVVLVEEAPHDVRIEVVDENERPAPGVPVTFESMITSDRCVVTTGADGTARTSVLGRAIVYVKSAQDRPLLVRPRALLLPPSRTVARFTVQSAAHATGVVIDPDGRPLARAGLEVTAAGFPRVATTTNAQGQFDVVVPANSAAVIELLHPCPAADAQRDAMLLMGRVEARAGDTGLVLRAQRVPSTGSLCVLVQLPTGLPAPGVEVMASAADTRFTATTDAQGCARFTDLPLREIEISTGSAAGHQPALETRATPNGQSVTLRLRATATVAGTLLDAERRPVAHASVNAHFDAGRRYASQTDAAGRFRIEFPADEAGLPAISVQRVILGTLQDVWLDREVRPGAGDVEIVLR